MKLSEFKTQLNKIDNLHFELPTGERVSAHFHVTEVGQITKKFIDCGGTIRNERVVNFQLWQANDYDHRLHPEKLMNIINLSENKLGILNDEIEIEYQAETIGKYGVEFNDGIFKLTSTQTDCLALNSCGISPAKIKVSLSGLKKTAGEPNTCTPGGGCC